MDIRTVGQELGARYVMEGSLRQAGSTLRVAVQLVDATTGAHLWAETYDRPFTPDAMFALQDDLVPRIVSTVADWYGVLPHSMSEALRRKPLDQLTPYEALLRSFGYYERVVPAEHAAARSALERAVEEAPGNADWAMLSMLYGEEHRFGFNAVPDPARACTAGRAAGGGGRALESLRAARDGAGALLPQGIRCLPQRGRASPRAQPDGRATGTEYLGHLLAFAGDWERGCELAEKARHLNPHHPAWYWALPFLDAYRKADYQPRVPSRPTCRGNSSHTRSSRPCVASWENARRPKTACEAAGPQARFPPIAREEFAKWYLRQLVERLIEGLRKAGLAIAPGGGRDDRGPSDDGPSGTPARDSAAVAIAVLPFSDMSPEKDQEYLCEGMAEEIMNALVRVEGMRVASRASTFRARQGGGDLKAIARALSVGHVLEGSVRSAGTRLRVTAQLTDVASGYHLWSERFDREAADVFAVQDEIASSVPSRR